MNLVASSLQSLRQMFLDKTDEFINLTNNVHMLWLEEIQQEAKRMFSRWGQSFLKNIFVFLLPYGPFS